MQDILNQVKKALPQQQPPSGNDITAEEMLKKMRVTPQTILPPLQNLFKIHDIPCFCRGELVAVCGKAKSGKTFFLSIIMAACMTTKVLDVCRDAGDTENPPPLRVLWLDTEQSQQSTQEILLRRIIPLAGERPDIDEYFFSYNLRGLGYRKRRELMETAIKTIKPDIAIIDGIKDLVTDINDATQATMIMEQLMALAQNNNCCIVNVLHQNKSEADQNMRGSIGTELTNKAFEVYTCEINEEAHLFKVKQRLSRRQRIRKNIFYRLDDNGIPGESNPQQEQPRDARGRFMTNNPRIPTDNGVGMAFNRKYIIPNNDDNSYRWNIPAVFEDAFEGRVSRSYGQLMAVVLRLTNIQNKNIFYSLFRDAEQQMIVKTYIRQDTGENWVEYIGNTNVPSNYQLNFSPLS